MQLENLERLVRMGDRKTGFHSLSQCKEFRVLKVKEKQDISIIILIENSLEIKDAKYHRI
jgi:hypothetical protein